MVRAIYRRMQTVMLVAMLVGPVFATGDEVGIEDLVKKVPILSPNNEELQSFRFRAQLPTVFGSGIRLDVGWTRPDDFGVVCFDQKSGTPFAFIAQKKGMLYDTTRATVMWDESIRPILLVQAEERECKWYFGCTNKGESEFTVDLPSFFRHAGSNPKLSKLNATTWKFTCASKSGRSQIVAYFKPSQRWPLERFEIRSLEDDSLLLSVEDISINRPVEERLRKFPSLDRIPRELITRRLSPRESSGGKVGSLSRGIQLAAELTRAMASRAAIYNTELRNHPLLGKVDWDEAVRADRIIGPKLRTLLQIDTEKNRPVIDNAAESE